MIYYIILFFISPIIISLILTELTIYLLNKRYYGDRYSMVRKLKNKSRWITIKSLIQMKKNISHGI